MLLFVSDCASSAEADDAPWSPTNKLTVFSSLLPPGVFCEEGQFDDDIQGNNFLDKFTSQRDTNNVKELTKEAEMIVKLSGHFLGAVITQAVFGKSRQKSFQQTATKEDVTYMICQWENNEEMWEAMAEKKKQEMKANKYKTPVKQEDVATSLKKTRTARFLDLEQRMDEEIRTRVHQIYDCKEAMAKAEELWHQVKNERVARMSPPSKPTVMATHAKQDIQMDFLR